MASAQVELSRKALALKKEKALGLKEADEPVGLQSEATPDPQDVLLTRVETAEYLRKSVPTLERWAREGYGPRPLACGRRALYRLSDLRAFLDPPGANLNPLL